MKYVFDIDGTICNTVESEYENSVPIISRIRKINSLFDDGHDIFFLTARGMGRTKNDQKAAIDCLYSFTKKQLDSWGVKYHRLFLGKPAGDIYIDDKGCKDIDFFQDSN